MRLGFVFKKFAKKLWKMETQNQMIFLVTLFVEFLNTCTTHKTCKSRST